MDALARDIGGDSLGSLGHLRRYWWLALLGTLLGVGLGIAYTGSVAKTYSSTALLEVLPPPGQTSVTGARINSSVNMDNELQFATSLAVAQSAQKLMRVDTDPADLESQATAVVPPNTSFLQIAFSALSPDQARSGAHAFAEAYINERTDSARASIELQSEGISKQIAALQTQLTAATAIAATAINNSPAKLRALANINIDSNQITSLQQRLSPLTTTDFTAAQITNDADLPTEPSKPIPALYIGGALFLGLVFGLALMLLAARLDRKVRDASDIEQRVARPVLGEIRNRTKSREVHGVLASRSGGDQFDRLRLRLEAVSADRARSVLVVAVGSAGAASFGAANIAAAEARSGQETVLVCANPESTAARMFGLTDAPGLSALLLDTADVSDVTQRVTGRPRLSIITAGTDLSDAYDLVPVDRVAALVDSLVLQGKCVVVEAPALGRGVQALDLARRIGVTVVVVEVGRCQVPEVTAAFDELTQMGAYVPGAVLIPGLATEADVEPAEAARPRSSVTAAS